MGRKEVKEKMQIYCHGKINEDGFIMLRTVIFSLSLIIIISALLLIFLTIMKFSRMNYEYTNQIIVKENLRVTNENN